jgi:hypothetical protein
MYLLSASNIKAFKQSTEMAMFLESIRKLTQAEILLSICQAVHTSHEENMYTSHGENMLSLDELCNVLNWIFNTGVHDSLLS